VKIGVVILVFFMCVVFNFFKQCFNNLPTMVDKNNK
jgi:hypothetical protein